MSFLRGLVFFILAIVLAGVISAAVFFHYLSPLDPASQDKLLRIQNGASLYQVTETLNQEHLIRDMRAFKLYARIKGWQNRLQSGYYRFSARQSSSEILETMVLGKTEKIPYTIPEGYRAEQASRRLSEYLLSPERYLEIAKKPEQELLRRFPFLSQETLKNGLEGFLFPDTYYLDGEEKQLIQAQLKRFEEVILPLWKKRPAGHTLNLYQTVTLASIVELEGLLDRELPIIAGVFLKRLSIGMKLESDPTTEYALGWHQGPKGLSLKDIQVDSPYNTYRYKGLTPGPIGNPGLAAIKAVLFPEKTPYLYFVARGDGSHAFSKSYPEHLSAIRRIYSGKL
ncbi:endolytic transglycosylase MltG [bacterium (Candidatus Blackallbacteria) CG17_big_fil_post_rev_8_21_14_2_50_48_46]|uniref:Endolytic murein transglycosylase n=1 Tax=bacterium (Candidatus Blackallbacteria) CG17_big_fil_post_rev_8_21_14_2_50_48_46 TaxID=2014261 RepID=A0A2M7GB14_9BACT|nr:MAG: ABC transporter substrate-binding protein [bacterium (Candidatus Blackallbacteria) CG18_big_fil_WC_8_21_14_2_50_49_26]PIW19364.1 MAG: endolytic transglycosylase MltG [bacterium (Candidatus Blackallbacteria) CG17_big_fil_post_rev_8_21_14_2_50_48_46]PIW49032.1 MAG: endolytic transglycosylase MltG [bacterium (Candidatus Blackallbacteria) CG13_big_fil_rev_8_21_14_2_50_49_14]